MTSLARLNQSHSTNQDHNVPTTYTPFQFIGHLFCEHRLQFFLGHLRSVFKGKESMHCRHRQLGVDMPRMCMHRCTAERDVCGVWVHHVCSCGTQCQQGSYRFSTRSFCRAVSPIVDATTTKSHAACALVSYSSGTYAPWGRSIHVSPQ